MSEIEAVKQILSTAFFIPVASIKDDDLISSLKGMDSLSFEGLILELEQLAGREPDPVKLLEARTVADLAELLRDMKQPAAATAGRV